MNDIKINDDDEIVDYDKSDKEIKKMLKLGKVVELKTTDGQTIYMDVQGMKQSEIKDIQDGELEFRNGQIHIIVKDDNSKKKKRK